MISSRKEEAFRIVENSLEINTICLDMVLPSCVKQMIQSPSPRYKIDTDDIECTIRGLLGTYKITEPEVEKFIALASGYDDVLILLERLVVDHKYDDDLETFVERSSFRVQKSANEDPKLLEEERDELFKRLSTLHTISSVCDRCKVNQIIALWSRYFMTHELQQDSLAELSKLAGKQVLLQDDTDTDVDTRRCIRTTYLPMPNWRQDSFAFF